MLAAYQLDRAQRNLAGYAVLGVPRPLGVRTLRGDLSGHALRGLGAAVPITAAEAFQKALSMYSGQHVNPRDSGNQAWVTANEQQIEAGQFLPYSGCSAQSPTLNLFATVSGLALGTTAAGVGILTSAHLIPAAAVPVIGWVIAGVGAIVGLIGMIFAHHAAAVKRDLNFSCGALPAVNNAFQIIVQAVANGQMKPADAAAALPEIYSQFMKAGGASGSASGPSGIPGGGTAINNFPYCNSNCELSICLLGMVLFWQAQYLAMADQQAAAPAPSPAPNLVTPAPILVAPQPAPFVSSGSKLVLPAPAAPISSGPNWLMLAALVAGGFAIAKAF